MGLSVTDPVSRAIDRTKHVLFKPFNLGKWFVLGFCAFLAYLGEGGSANFQGVGNIGAPSGPTAPARPIPAPPPGFPLPPPAPPPPSVWSQVQPYLPWIILGVVLLIVLSFVLLWLKCRGKFMFVDGIVHNRSAVVAPWREFRTQGNSLFAFTVAFGLLCLLAYALCAGLGLAIAWPDIRAEQFGTSATVALFVGIPLLLLIACIALPISLLLEDFVVPAMYLRRTRVMETWRIVWPDAIRGRFWTIVLFYLMKVALGIAMAILGVIAICATCCIGALPYLNSVVLLPIYVFSRCYTLYFLEQLGPEWQFFHLATTYCARCGYNLHLNVSGICPECGTPIPHEQRLLVQPPGTPPVAPPAAPWTPPDA